MAARSKRRPKQANNPKVYTFNLSFTAMVSIVVAGAAVLTAFFALGVLVGRGYHPEKAVPHLAQIMPATGPANASEPEEDVLKAEELGYRERLTTDGPEERTEPKKPAASKAAPPAKVETAAAQSKQTAASQKKPAASAQAAQSPTPSEPPAAGTDGPVYDYVYQVAAFADIERALDLQAGIRGLGLIPTVEQVKVGQKNWYRVMVFFQGRPDQTRDMKAKLATLGIRDVIMKSKKPL